MQLVALFRLGFPSAPYLKYLTLLHTVTRWLVLQKAWDELWIAEKFQSNPEIAGSLRNSFRASVEYE